MRKLILFLSLLSPVLLSAQTIIENPQCGMSKESYVKIPKIELKDDATVIHFNVLMRAGFKIFIPKDTYIQPEGGEKLTVIDAEGVPLDKLYPIPKSKKLSYSLTFPPIDQSCTKLDYCEGRGSGAWFFYDIQLKKAPSTKKVPDELYGKWHQPTDGVLALCLFDTVAVYNNTVWRYDAIDLKKGSGTITLKSPEKSISLHLKIVKKGLMMGESEKDMAFLTRKRIYRSCGDKALSTPVLRNDTAVYSGYIYKYNPKCGVNTMTVSYLNILTTENSTSDVTIDEDGFFSVKIPLLFPHLCTMKIDFFNSTTLYLEPGKELFHVISFDYDRRKTHQFMGELAGINNELDYLKKLGGYRKSDVRNNILETSSHDYITYYKDLQKKDMHALDSIYETGRISDKAFQLKKADLQYNYAEEMLSYNMHFESAYRKEHNIDRKQREIGIEYDSIRPADINFINNDFANSELALTSNAYYFFLNRMEYHDLMGSPVISITTSDILKLIHKINPEPDDFEMMMIQRMQKQDSIMSLPDYANYISKYQKKEFDFRMKYRETYKLLYDSLKTYPTFETVKNDLESKGIKLTDDENEMVDANTELKSKSFMAELENIYEGISKDSVRTFFSNVREYYPLIRNTKELEYKASALGKCFGIEKGLMTDIMLAQDLNRKIVKEKSPMDDMQLEESVALMTSPVIANFIRNCNQQAIADNEYRKAHPLATVHEVPDVENDQLFEAIMKNHEGKVIYVDFWATWCAPCRSGIERIAPLKDEMENENVAFVYITGESSPLGTWENMIPGIKGEHYRVSGDQWKYLCKKFSITGIPHYMLVDKDGNIVNPHLPHMDNDGIKNLLAEQMAK